MKAVLRNILIVLYAVIAIFVTVCLLSFNDFRVSEFGKYSFVLVDNDQLQPDYNQGDLVVVNKNNKINVGDKIFFYNTYERTVPISVAEVTEVEDISTTQKTYTLDGDHTLSSDYVIGTTNTAKSFNKLGTILGFLESKWGFLFLIVLPSLIAFLYEIWDVISEIRQNKKEEKEEKRKARRQARETEEDNEQTKE